VVSTHIQNQLGAETNGPFTSDPNTNKNAVDANRSGTSTPGYAEEDGKLLDSLPLGVENRKHKLIEELEYGVLMVELDSGRRKTQGGGGSSGLVSIESSCHFRLSLADLIPACGYDHRTRTATTKRMVLPTRTTLTTNKVDAYNSACCVSVARARIDF
jgi:hypothetical protein